MHLCFGNLMDYNHIISSKKEKKMTKLRVRFLGHSGFLVEAEGRFLLFDYYTDRAGLLKGGLPSGGEGAVLISHSHLDHFNRAVFDMAVPGRTVIVADSGVPAPKEAEGFLGIEPGGSAELGWARVKAYGSTDVGCSFLVEMHGAKLFHAGDLNDWYWEGESTPEELVADETRFFGELAKITEGDIDIAFFPVDMRLGKHAARGVSHFAKALRPRIIIPMHLNGRPGEGLIDELEGLSGLGSEVIMMKEPGEELVVGIEEYRGGGA